MLKNYQELNVWKKSYELCLKIYLITKDFPEEERYGLTAQIRRSAVSISSNIAEGYGRQTTKEYIQSLYIAYGSICELETQTLIAKDLAYVKVEEFQRIQGIIKDVERMLKALINALKAKRKSARTLESSNP